MIEFRKEESRLICKFTAEIVASKIPEMRTILATFLDNNQAWNELVFDCQQVKTMDSIGVNFIVGAYKKASSSEKKFKITGCNETVAKVLRLFKLDEKFVIEPTNLK